MYKNTICLAIVQRFGGGFPFFSVFYVCFYKKMGGSSGFSAWGVQRGKCRRNRVEKRRGLFAYPAKNE